jgi:hypothetical protein
LTCRSKLINYKNASRESKISLCKIGQSLKTDVRLKNKRWPSSQLEIKQSSTGRC